MHSPRNALTISLFYYIVSSQDLIKFLQSTGPLERSIDKERTSPKVYESLMSDDKAQEDQAKKANERVRKRVPIMSGEGRSVNASGLDAVIGGVNAGDLKNSGDEQVGVLNPEEDGTMTTRTTNFSTVDRSNIDSFGVSRRNLFDLSMKLQKMQSDSEEWKKIVGQEYNNLLSKEVSKSKEQTDKELALLFDTMRYIRIPVFMRDTGDTEEEVIGIAPDRIEGLKMSGLKIPKEMSLQLVMLDEDV